MMLMKLTVQSFHRQRSENHADRVGVGRPVCEIRAVLGVTAFILRLFGALLEFTD